MLIRTKLHPPRQAVDALPRRALVERLTAPALPPLVIINAPAGYGKSTLLSQCYASWKAQGMTAAWYSADDSQYESDQFFAYLIAALHQTGLPLPYSSAAIEAGLPGIVGEAAAKAVVLALEASEEPIRIVIDDYNRVASPSIDAFINYVVARLPAHATILVATRGDLGLAVSGLRTKGLLWSFDQRDLSFTETEAQAFFDKAGLCPDLGDILKQTEGWPAALQLLRLWLVENAGELQFRGLTGCRGDLADYLAEQVFAGLDVELQRLLLVTSIARRVSAGLAEALLGGGDGYRMLGRLERMNLLITPLDDQREWYRFHPLLNEYLREQLQISPGFDIADLHRRAATWYAEKGDLAEAIYHAGHLDDPDAPIGILEAAGGWRVGLRGGLSLLRGLQQVGLTEPERYPRVWLGQVYLAGQEGRIPEARAMLDRLWSRLHETDRLERDLALYSELLGNEVVTRIYEDRPIPTHYVELIQKQLAGGTLSPVETTLATHLLCLVHYEAGDEAQCRTYGEQALRMARANSMAHAETYLYQYLGLSQLRQGRRPEAEIFFRRALEHAVRNFGEGSQPVASAQVLLARTHYLAGRAGAAQDLLPAAIAAIEHGEGWFDLFEAGYSTLAWLAARQQDWPAVEQVLARAARTIAARRQPRLAWAIEVLRLKLAVFSGEHEKVQSLAVQLAERRHPERFDAELALAADIALQSAWLLLGDPRFRDLSSRAVASGSAISQIETLVLKARQAADHGDLVQMIDSIRSAIGLAESEELTGIFAQFGPLLLPVIERSRENFHHFAPEERTFLTRLGATVAVPAVRATMPPAGEIVVTPREVEVLRALADGLSSKEIALRLGVAESTIKTHRINLYRKLNVTIRSKAIVAGRLLGLI
jgi:LuxR family maltose regulon positive regulatory protein